MPRRPIRRILIANRGEIAVRIIRACRELGITAIAVFSDLDRTAFHVRRANEAYALGGSTLSETYLDGEKIVAIAKRAGADAIHPGYGFLSENAGFAARVEEAGLRFIGPSAEAIRALGDKMAARSRARALGIPTVPGTMEALRDARHAAHVAAETTYPVLLKAAAGGGGRGMRIVRSAEEMESAFVAAQSESAKAFGDGRLYLERLIEKPRHVEIQVLADGAGNTVYLGERECSIQRRHQKLIEESPSPAIDESTRRRMGEAAVALANDAGYRNAGTFEFILDQNGQFYLLEVNTRLQVEHPVTEVVTGIDLVAWQIRIAGGAPLTLTQADIRPRGHAIECRINAEDPSNNFMPDTGMLERYVPPEGPRVRVESGYRPGDRVQLNYDALLAKVICWGATRSEAIAAMKRALAEFHIGGVRTTIPFAQFVLSQAMFLKGMYHTGFIEEYFRPDTVYREGERAARAAALIAALTRDRNLHGAGGNGTAPGEGARNAWKKNRLDSHR